MIRWREATCVALGSLFFAFLFTYPITFHLSHSALSQWSLNDWDLGMEWWTVPWLTLTKYHQFPLWDPYKCGGMPLLANPQSIFLTPFFLLTFLFGPDTSIHLSIVLHLAVAFSGAYFLARVLGLCWLAAIACAGCFAGSSWYPNHLAVGHVVFLSYAYAPWVIAFFWRAIGGEKQPDTDSSLGVHGNNCLSGECYRTVCVVATAFTLALMFFEGGIYAVPQTALVLALLVVWFLVLPLQGPRYAPVLALLATGALAVGFAAIKLFPTIAFVGWQPRGISAHESNTIAALIRDLFSRNQNPAIVYSGEAWGFYEYGAYVGLYYLALAVVGVVYGMVYGKSRHLPWRFFRGRVFFCGILLGAFLAIAAGDWGHYSPWVLLHHLPVFINMRLPSRNLIFVTLAVGVLAAYGVNYLWRTEAWMAAVVFVAAALIDSWFVCPQYLNLALVGTEPPMQASPVFHQVYDSWLYGHMTSAALSNKGAIGCYEPVGVFAYASGSDTPGYRGEQYLLGLGTVTLTRWTPNVLEYDVNPTVPTALVINQNYDGGWRLSQGRGVVYSQAGLLAVSIPPGPQHLKLTYLPWSFVVGTIVTLATIGAAIWFAKRSQL